MSTSDSTDKHMPETLETDHIRFIESERSGAMPGRSGNVFRRITRNWWRILFLWLVISSALTYGIYRFVEPTYLAFGLVKVESNQPDLFGPSMDPLGRNLPPSYLTTEIETMKSNPLLELALTGDSPSIANSPNIKASMDPKNTLRSKLAITVLPNTHWIRIAVESTAPEEARDMVNAVIKAYEEAVVTESLGTPSTNKRKARKQIASKIANGFREYREALAQNIKATRDAMRDLVRRDDDLATKAQQENKGDPGVARPRNASPWNSHLNEIEVTFLRDDLQRYCSMFDVVNRKVESLEFTNNKAAIEIERTDEAELPTSPFTDERVKYMAIAPVGVLFSLFGLFLVFGDIRRRQDKG